MALADTITALGTSIINLVGTRAKTDLSNITSAGETVITNLASGVPVGTVIAYMGTSAPAGFLLMDGGEYSKTTYADLYAVVGDSMGTATDSSKFVIADMTDGRYLMGSTVAGIRISQQAAKVTWFLEFRALSSNDGSVAVRPIHSGSGMTTTQSTWSGSHAALSFESVTDPQNQTFTWSYGSGNYYRPHSRTCLMYIKY